MGAGILPTTIHNNKLYFLFGKENKYADTPGWSDIGGGTDKDETFMQTAMREGTEELTGFLGMENDIKKLLTRYGTYNIDWSSLGGKTYRMHIFPMAFDPMLPVYYNNNHKFIERKLSANMVKNSKIFEKDEIRWVCIDDIPKMRKKFRSYFQKGIHNIHPSSKIYIYNIISMANKEDTGAKKFKNVSKDTLFFNPDAYTRELTQSFITENIKSQLLARERLIVSYKDLTQDKIDTIIDYIRQYNEIAEQRATMRGELGQYVVITSSAHAHLLIEDTTLGPAVVEQIRDESTILQVWVRHCLNQRFQQ